MDVNRLSAVEVQVHRAYMCVRSAESFAEAQNCPGVACDLADLAIELHRLYVDLIESRHTRLKRR